MKYYTTDSKNNFLEQEFSFKTDNNHEMQKVNIYPEIRFQKILGFGGAFTEAASDTFFKMSEAKQSELINLYFGPDGNNYNFCRTHIQSCDFALGNYAYIDDSSDTKLESFTIERDKKSLIPLMQKALEQNSEISLLASPWSPPAFMKSNKEMNHGGKLNREYYQMWADMVSRYITEYKKLGINIERLTIQNEPAATQSWDSCLFTGREEAEFAVSHLRPALDRDGHKGVKINIWDHNKDIIIERTDESFSVPESINCIDGIAFHWYTGDHFDSLAYVADKYREKELIFTEGCVEYSRFENGSQIGYAEIYAHDIIGNLNSGMNGYIDWNIYLNQEGGPNHVGNFCDAPIMCNTESDVIDIKKSYYYIGHFSRFIKPGAVRVLSSKYSSNLEVTTFRNPDGSMVMVVLNLSEKDVDFIIGEDRKSTEKLTSRSHSIMTFCW